MKLRRLAHRLVLTLFVTATMLAAVVSPVTAGYARMDAEAVMPMATDMPCCPPDQERSQDCTKGCLALSFCLTKCFAAEPASSLTALSRPILGLAALAGDDAARASRPLGPPARPPRT
ncbi:hypothetical protein [Bosea sp. 2RAB26]|uniref:hypothetical protein n=1 Tax=Bosea sp. 2RAB26 TaxID=3237476 RepID=UPI003F92FE90